MNPLTTLVFVYGTLRAGGHNHRRCLAGVPQLVEEIRTLPRYTMVSLGGCPGVFAGGRTKVLGEVYEVTPEVLERLDRLEGHPRFYRRQKIELEKDLGREVESYLLPASEYRDFQPIESGNWLSFCSRKAERAEG